MTHVLFVEVVARNQQPHETDAQLDILYAETKIDVLRIELVIYHYGRSGLPFELLLLLRLHSVLLRYLVITPP